jgi:hypothetical protein
VSGEGGLRSVPGSLDKKGGRKCRLSLSKKWHLPLPFLFSNPILFVFAHTNLGYSGYLNCVWRYIVKVSLYF